MGCIEDIILRHSGRGMELLRTALPEDYCMRAARHLLSLPRGVILMITGFCVAGHPETDGPAGTYAVARALAAIGFTPVIVTDSLCRGIFEPECIPTVYLPTDADADAARALLARCHPVALFTLERCGPNAEGDYCNMHGRSVRASTAPLDLLFTAAETALPSVGVGDGGNEIGMGLLREVISERLSIRPCVVATDELVIATVSNWGGYGLCACLSRLTGLSLTPSYEEIHAFLKRGEQLGCVDGLSGLPAATEDGFPEETTREILEALNASTQEV